MLLEILDDHVCLKLGNRACLDNVDDLRGELLLHINDFSASVHLDLSELHSLDTSGVQLILSLMKTLKEQEKSVNIINASNEVKNVFEILHLSENL